MGQLLGNRSEIAGYSADSNSNNHGFVEHAVGDMGGMPDLPNNACVARQEEKLFPEC